jgi:HSP20 family protein
MPYASADKKRAWHRLERGFGRFERVIRVPQGLDPDTIVASMADGVLTLLIPKPEARKPRRIEIGISGPQQQQIEESTEERELAGTTS